MGGHLRTKIPKAKIARIPEEMKPWLSWMIEKMLFEIFGFPSWGARKIAMAVKTTTQMRPTVTIFF
jgi:hypothetical protein